MPEGVLLETNWLIDVAMEQDIGSQAIWRLMNAGRVEVLLPALCLTESIKVLERWHQRWHAARTSLETELSQLERAPRFQPMVTSLSDALVDLIEIEDRVERQIWEVVEAGSDGARLIHLDRETIAMARDAREFLDLSPADALVLASVVAANRRGLCSRFLSRDRRAFGTRDLQRYFQREGIEFHSSATDFLWKYIPDWQII